MCDYSFNSRRSMPKLANFRFYDYRMHKNCRLFLLILGILIPIISVGQVNEVCMFAGKNYKYEIVERVPSELDLAYSSTDLEQILCSELDLLVNVVWINDSQRPNAIASSESTDSLSTNGTIYLGINLISVVDCVLCVLWHEAAHIYDFKHKFQFSAKHTELFADYFAGFMLGLENGNKLLEELNMIVFGFKTEEEVLNAKNNRNNQAAIAALDFWGPGDLDSKTESLSTSLEREYIFNSGYNMALEKVYMASELMSLFFDQGISKEGISDLLFKFTKVVGVRIKGYKDYQFVPLIDGIKKQYIDKHHN